MNVFNFNKKLQKIAALTDNVQADSQFSLLERDLLLSYIRELYDIALDDKPPLQKPVAKAVYEGHTIKLPVEEPQMQEVLPTVIKPVEIHEPVHVMKPEPVIDQPKITEPVRAIEIQSQPSSVSEEVIAEIFADEKVSDLSDRLSLSPIPDLTKSMGINERIFTQQELFGNDQAAFTEVMSSLNRMNTFAEAKHYLTEHVIPKYQWTSESKVKKAVTFVRHIKRKYI